MTEAPTDSTRSAAQTRAQSPVRAWILVFAVAFVLFVATANRGAQWQDSGFHILRVVTGEPLNPLGLALSHPLHHWLGRAIVWARIFEPCFAVTLISVLAGAAAVANVYGCVLTLTRRQSASCMAAVSLAIAHTFWQMATVAETYTLAAALLSAECWCLVAFAAGHRPSRLWLMCLFNGLGIANHMLATLTTPVVAIVVLHAAWSKRVRVRHVMIGAVLWLVGSSLYGGMILTELIGSGDLGGTLHSALFGHAYAEKVLQVLPATRLLLIGAAFVVLSFPNLLPPSALYGIVRAGRSGVPVVARRALLAGLLIHLCFVARYNVVDQHTFFVPAYSLLAIFGGIGLGVVLARWRPRPRRVAIAATVLLLAMTPVIYVVAPRLARTLDVLKSVEHHKPYRDDYAYLFTPWSVAERSADRMSREAVDLAGDNGLILVEDPMAEFAVRYRAGRSGRASIEITHEITPDLIREAVGQARSIVLVPLDVNAPATPVPDKSWGWQRIGDLYQLGLAPPKPARPEAGDDQPLGGD
jgi:hypothetical protein